MLNRDLFGGAIVAKTTPDLVDASDLRQIPNTQEVFIYQNSNVSIVVEILQQVDPSHLDDAIRFHFDSLAHDNSAQNTKIDIVYRVPNDRGDDTPSATILKGTQYVPKFNHLVPDKVQVLMALYRIETKAIDLVVTFNIPVEAVGGGAVNAQELAKAQDDFDVFVRSLRIVNFGLFA